MKNYEKLELEVELTADVITTSKEVTTGDITIDWGATTNPSAFEL